MTNKESEAYIRTYETDNLNPNQKQKVLFNIPSEKKFVLKYVIFNGTADAFIVRNDTIKHFKENPITLFGSALNQVLPISPHGIIMSGSNAGFNIQNISTSADSLNFCLIGEIS